MRNLHIVHLFFCLSLAILLGACNSETSNPVSEISTDQSIELNLSEPGLELDAPGAPGATGSTDDLAATGATGSTDDVADNESEDQNDDEVRGAPRSFCGCPRVVQATGKKLEAVRDVLQEGAGRLYVEAQGVCHVLAYSPEEPSALRKQLASLGLSDYVPSRNQIRIGVGASLENGITTLKAGKRILVEIPYDWFFRQLNSKNAEPKAE